MRWRQRDQDRAFLPAASAVAYAMRALFLTGRTARDGRTLTRSEGLPE